MSRRINVTTVGEGRSLSSFHRSRRCVMWEQPVYLLDSVFGVCVRRVRYVSDIENLQYVHLYSSQDFVLVSARSTTCLKY